MIQHLARPPQLVRITCAAILAVTGWYALQTVHPDCTYGMITMGDEHGNPLPDAQGKVQTPEEQSADAYQQAIASGQCEAPHARWHDWLG
ncbi:MULTISPECIES: hypothetical protein [unclassified Kitasatospora]|uniref:hypothetical protein n=1 Tax=unclassified Kitasatospora TaxID=2633591 RepID=UPI000710178E|nr:MULTISPECIES: hypothetical protein [unclassified Kitasatospora]KQV08742.1 hypothetical protein ASC99_36400 [Kitasatospora sp. Root107]KRB68879.1 hypothetical protein ASE03_28680 [Kitasatospora sp. Root187]